jgi:hypothetical protein
MEGKKEIEREWIKERKKTGKKEKIKKEANNARKESRKGKVEIMVKGKEVIKEKEDKMESEIKSESIPWPRVSCQGIGKELPAVVDPSEGVCLCELNCLRR